MGGSEANDLESRVRWLERELADARRLADITEQRTRESQHAFRAQLLDAVGEAVAATDPAGRITYWNRATSELLGWSADEAVGRSLEEVALTVVEAPQLVSEALNHTALGSSWSGELTLIRKNGAKFWARVTTSPVFDASHRVVGLIGTAFDLTDRKQREQALAESETRFRELFANMSNGVAIYRAVGNGEDFEFVDINPAGARIGGHTQNEVIGRAVTEVYPGVRQLGLFDVFQEVWRTGKPQHHPVSAYEDGRITIWVENYVSKLPSGEIFAVYDDVTQRKAAETALVRSEQRAQGIIMSIADPMVMMDANLMITWANERAIQMFGPCLGKHCLEVFRTDCDEPCEACPVLHTLAEHAIHDHETVLMANGEPRTFWCTVSVVSTDAAGAPEMVVEILRDITERKEAEKARQRYETRLQQSQKMEALGTLAGGIAHDFNNVLAAILSFASIARVDVGDTHPARESLDEVLGATARARQLVSQILTFSRRAESARVPVSLPQAIRDTTRLLRATIPTTIDIKVTIHAAHCVVSADPIQLHQLLVNLGTNAYQAIGEHRGTISITLRQVTIDRQHHPDAPSLQSGDYAELTVSDTGCGIPERVRERVFEPFFTTRGEGEGTGLGLSIVHGVTTAMGGAVTFESTEGRGTTFAILLPVLASTVPAKSPTSTKLTQGHGERVLVVEDENSVRRALDLVLNRLGYKPHTFGGPAPALAAFRASPQDFELVLTDQAMPEMSGAELIAELRRVRADIPIMLMTGFSRTLTESAAKELGVARLLRKPVDIGDLASALRAVLDASNAEGSSATSMPPSSDVPGDKPRR